MLFPASSASLAEATHSFARPPPRTKSVLLVEDNEEVAAVVRPVLGKMGCRVVHLDRG
jgi:hypothetical protein